MLATRDQPLGDLGDLARRFALRQDHFGKAFAQGTVVVHPGKAQVFKGQGLEESEGCVNIQGAALHPG